MPNTETAIYTPGIELGLDTRPGSLLYPEPMHFLTFPGFFLDYRPRIRPQLNKSNLESRNRSRLFKNLSLKNLNKRDELFKTEEMKELVGSLHVNS